MKSFDVTAEIINDADEVVTVTGTFYPADPHDLHPEPCLETEETSEAARVALWDAARARRDDDLDARNAQEDR
jgi:hypothetical protein